MIDVTWYTEFYNIQLSKQFSMFLILIFFGTFGIFLKTNVFLLLIEKGILLVVCELVERLVYF